MIMEEAKEEIKKQEQPYLIPGAIVAAGVIIAFAVLYSNPGPKSLPKNDSAAAGAIPQAHVIDAKSLPDDDPSLGNPAAPVTVVEFGDFQCPFCGRFFKTVEAQLIEKYVKTGQVKFVYRDFAFLGDESNWAAEAANCANEEGKYWQYHDYLYSHQKGENEGAFSKENLKQFARELGLNGNQFDMCLDSDKYAKEIEKDTVDGRTAGVSGTPTSFVNGRIITGAVPFAQLAGVIDEELKKVK